MMIMMMFVRVSYQSAPPTVTSVPGIPSAILLPVIPTSVALAMPRTLLVEAATVSENTQKMNPSVRPTAVPDVMAMAVD